MIKELFRTPDMAKLSKHAGKITLLVLGVIICLYLTLANGEKKAEVSGENAKSYDDYAERLEDRLAQLICRVDGAGECYVMVMLADGGREVYGVEEKVSETSGSSLQKETSYAVTKDQSGESPIKLTEYPPTISGVAVVCRGGGSVTVKAEIAELISSLTGLPSSCIHISRLG